MIKKLNVNDKKSYMGLLDFVSTIHDSDFYYTDNNSRIYPTEIYQLKKFFKEAKGVYTLKSKLDYTGVIVLIKSIGGDIERYYIKLLAIDTKVAEDLLTGLIWQYESIDLFVKINKQSKFLNVFKRKNFKFKGGRGTQILLKKDLYIKENNNVRFK